MCGLAALISADGRADVHGIRAMCDAVRYRGPDGEGYALFAGDRAWQMDGPDTPSASRSGSAAQIPNRADVALGHRRLSILDLSAAGHQPMPGLRQRYWIIHNGEVYNYRELRRELESLGHEFASGTDTEIIIAAFHQWGARCLERFNGMFAFVLYDHEQRRIFAARDRYGVKPLYWWRMPDGTLAFASEIKQFSVLPGWSARLNGQAAYDYLNWGLTDHGDTTMFENVRQMRPGSYVLAVIDALAADPQVVRWYEPGSSAATASLSDAVAHWRTLFLDAVRLRLRADVSVGTALSGGLDSSSIVCAVHRLRAEEGVSSGQNSFSARSRDPLFDEGRYIAAVVKQTGVQEHAVWPDVDDLFENLGALAWHMDEPFGSTSVFAEWCVFRTVGATSVKVTLDGHGADELLGGYVSFGGVFLANLLRRGHVLKLMREAKALLQSGRHSARELTLSALDDLMPAPLRAWLRRAGGQTSPMPDWIDVERLGARPGDPYADTQGRGRGIRGLSMSQLQATSLPMQLRWTDRSSMAHSVESRAPFLDVNLVEDTMALPDALKIDDGETKVVLRRALAGLLPAEIAGRRDKMGFVTPEEIWARRERPDSFRRAALTAIERSGGILNDAAHRRVDDILAGRRPYHASLWRMISFGAWLDRFNVAIH